MGCLIFGHRWEWVDHLGKGPVFHLWGCRKCGRAKLQFFGPTPPEPVSLSTDFGRAVYRLHHPEPPARPDTPEGG